MGLWPDASFDGNRTRNFRRSPQQQRADAYQVYLASTQWRCRRAEVIERGKFRCARCGKERRLQIHHASYLHFRDEYPSDLQALCRPCHERVTEEERERRGC
jgi:5-methylcytosine-specific restriction endonuclease McrA